MSDTVQAHVDAAFKVVNDKPQAAFDKYVVHLHGIEAMSMPLVTTEADYAESLQRNKTVPFLCALAQKRHLVSRCCC